MPPKLPQLNSQMSFVEEKLIVSTKLKVLCDMLDLTSEIYVEKETRKKPFFSELYTFSQECIRFPRLHKMQIRHLKNECTTAAEEDIRRNGVQQ